jgi:hypothetical protein
VASLTAEVALAAETKNSEVLETAANVAAVALTAQHLLLVKHTKVKRSTVRRASMRDACVLLGDSWDGLEIMFCCG